MPDTRHPPMPKALPRCEHGRSPGNCSLCQENNQRAAMLVKPLVDEFWAHRGQRDLEWLMVRAYFMGVRAEKEREQARRVTAEIERIRRRTEELTAAHSE